MAPFSPDARAVYADYEDRMEPAPQNRGGLSLGRVGGPTTTGVETTLADVPAMPVQEAGDATEDSPEPKPARARAK